MRLGVEAAIVRGELVPGDVEVDEESSSTSALPAGDAGASPCPGSSTCR